MANLNLSQFTEKTLVADADWVFVWDTVGAISKKVSRNSLLNSGTLTTSAPVTISQTWDGTGSTVFKALVVNATTPGTTSSSSSLLLDLQTGGATKFNVDKNGNVTVDPTNAAANFTFNVGQYIAFQYYGGAGWGTQALNILAHGGLNINSSLGVHRLGFAGDTFLFRDGAGQLALRNGAAAQTFNVYGTYTSGSVYERMFARYDGTALAFQVGTQHVGASARPLQLLTDNTARMTIGTNGNVGIGTTAPNSRLEVRDITNNANTVGQMLILSSDALAADKGGRFGLGGIWDGVGGTALWAEVAGLKENATSGNWAGYITFRTRPAGGAITDRLRIDSTGNVGIGTTAPSSKLQVTGGDVEIETVTSGIIMKAAGTSTRYRITLNAGGTALVFTAI